MPRDHLEKDGNTTPTPPSAEATARAELLTQEGDSDGKENPFLTELVILRWVILVVYVGLGATGIIPVHPLALAGSAFWILICNVAFTATWSRGKSLAWYEASYDYGDFLAVTFAIIAVANLNFPLWLAYVMILIPATAEHPSRKATYLKSAFAVSSYLVCATVIGLSGWQTLDIGIVAVTACLLAFIAYNLEVVFEGNRRLQATIQQLAVTDSLTGLSNRRQLSRFLGEPPTDKPLAVIIMDVDHFKQYNDAFGHLAGDKLLANLAAALREEFPDARIISRYGGDEFVVLLSCWTIEEAHARITNLLKGRSRERVPVSVGVSLWPSHHPTLDAAFAAADDCLRAAKRSRRGTYATTDSTGAIHLSDAA